MRDVGTRKARVRGRADVAGASGEAGQEGGPRKVHRAGGPGTRSPGAAVPAAPRVLLADDDDELRIVFRRFLIEAGFRVLAACSGEEALSLAQGAGGVDVLVTDVEMPGMSGPQLAARIGAAGARPPVIYVTGNPGSLPEACLKNDSLLLAKPIDLNELLEAIRALIA